MLNLHNSQPLSLLQQAQQTTPPEARHKASTSSFPISKPARDDTAAAGKAGHGGPSNAVPAGRGFVISRQEGAQAAAISPRTREKELLFGRCLAEADEQAGVIDLTRDANEQQRECGARPKRLRIE